MVPCWEFHWTCTIDLKQFRVAKLLTLGHVGGESFLSMISAFLSNSSWLCYWTIAWALIGPIFFAKYIHDPQYGLEVGLSSSWATGFWTFACYLKICSICFHTLLPPLSEKQTGALQVFVSYLMFQKPKPAKHSKLTTFDLKKQQRLNNLKASDVSTAWQHQPFQCKDPQVASNRWQVSRSPTSLPRVFGLTCLVPSRTPTGGGGVFHLFEC